MSPLPLNEAPAIIGASNWGMDASSLVHPFLVQQALVVPGSCRAANLAVILPEDGVDISSPDSPAGSAQALPVFSFPFVFAMLRS